MKNYLSSYERLAKIYAEKMGVRVIVKGSGFMTDGKNIYLAEIPEELNKELKDPTLAGLLHECGHIVHSDFDFLREENNKILNNFKVLLNNLEDCRIYKLGKDKYPGYDSLQKVGLDFIRDNLLKPQMSEISPKDLLGAFIQYKVSNMDTSFFPDKITEIGEKVKKFWENVEWKSGKEGTRQAEQITTQIVDYLNLQLEEKTKPIFDNPDSDTSTKSNRGERNKDSESKKKQEKEESEENKDKEENGDTNNEEEEKEENPNKSEEKEEEEKEEEEVEEEENTNKENDNKKEEKSNKDKESPSAQGKKESSGKQIDTGDETTDSEDEGGEELSESALEAINEIIKAGEAETNDSKDSGLMEKLEEIISKIIGSHLRDYDQHTIHPEIIKMDTEEHLKDPQLDSTLLESQIPTVIKDKQRKFRQTTSLLDKETQKLKNKILPLLISSKRSSFLFEQKEGIIDDANLYRLRKGDGRVYKTIVPGRKLNTAITILNDVSGSMRGSKVDMLRTTLLVIADTLHSLKVPFEILAFSTYYDSNDPIQHRIWSEYNKTPSRKDYPYNRIHPLRHIIVKSFNENYFNIRQTIPYLDAGDYNGDNESVKWAARRLLERREERKILFVLSDGMPNIRFGSDDILIKDLKKNVKEIEQLGIEIIGIGLLTNAPREFYPTSIKIDRIGDISSEVYRALMEKFTKRNTQSRLAS